MFYKKKKKTYIMNSLALRQIFDILIIDLCPGREKGDSRSETTRLQCDNLIESTCFSPVFSTNAEIFSSFE